MVQCARSHTSRTPASLDIIGPGSATNGFAPPAASRRPSGGVVSAHISTLGLLHLLTGGKEGGSGGGGSGGGITWVDLGRGMCHLETLGVVGRANRGPCIN